MPGREDIVPTRAEIEELLSGKIPPGHAKHPKDRNAHRKSVLEARLMEYDEKTRTMILSDLPSYRQWENESQSTTYRKN